MKDGADEPEEEKKQDPRDLIKEYHDYLQTR